MPPGVVLAALAGLSPAAPLPARPHDAVPLGLETQCHPWRLRLACRTCAGTYEVHAGLVLTVEGRRADLGELPGLFDRRWDAGGGWHHRPRAKACRAWTRGGRLEALEISLR